MNISAYPLAWPATFPRTKTRDSGRFKTTLAAAIRNVNDSLRLFSSDSGKKLENLVISSNVTLGVNRPDDTGVAIYFVWDGLQVCIPVDRYNSVEGNLQAIHHIIEARRVELRHGTLALVRASFTGFLALPSPNSNNTWQEVLGVLNSETSIDVVRSAYKALASKHHPDKGGSADKMAEINAAWVQAQKELND